MKKLKLLAVLLVIALILSPLTRVNASALTSIKDTISDSRPSTASNHEIQFTTPTGITAGQNITVTFPSGFTFNTLTEDDVDVADDGSELTTQSGACPGAQARVELDNTNRIVTITTCTGTTIAAGSVVRVRIGTNAVSSGTGANQITNHATPAVYTVAVGGSMADSGDALIAIVSTITASVTVDETLSFTVGAVNSGSCNLGGEITTTSTTIPFGTTAGNAFIDGCQSLTVSTNAAHGYSVTVVESDQLTFGATTIADGTCDGACDETTFGTWATSTNNGLAYCVEDKAGAPSGATSGQQCNDATPEFKIFPELGIETPAQIMSESSGVSSDQIHIGYRLSVPGNQAAGTYTNNIVFVATPTY
ncbi:MAG: hypothetical protein Fur003_2960 [Candidatus Dojkabacteria bacterium]